MFFFQKFKPNILKSNKMKGLRDKNGTLKSKLSDMLSIASDFYKDLYTEKETNPHIIDSFLQYVAPIVNNYIEIDLCRDFTVEELKDAIWSFLNGKTPGPDGLSIEFYKSLFSIIKDDLLNLFNTLKDNEFIPSKMKNGIIVLIPKGEF